MAGGGSLVLLYINVFLLIGVLMRHTFARLSSVIPYTVLLLLVGMVMGLGARMLRDEFAEEGDDSSAAASSSGSHASDTPLADDYLSALSMISSIEPHTLLYIFLPALLFESANAIESHVFRKARAIRREAAAQCGAILRRRAPAVPRRCSARRSPSRSPRCSSASG